LNIKVFYNYLQRYETTQEMRQNCSNLQILLDCTVSNGIFIKHYFITFTCSISCVTVLIL